MSEYDLESVPLTPEPVVTVQPVGDDNRGSDDVAPEQPPTHFDLRAVIACAWAVVSAYGWTPAHPDARAVPTRDRVRALILDEPEAALVADRVQPYLAEGERMAPIIIDTLRDAPRDPSRYQARLRPVLATDQINLATDLGLAVSAVHAYLQLQDQQPQPRRQPAEHLTYAGEVGETLTLTGQVIKNLTVRGFTATSPDNRMLVIDCGNAIATTVTAAGWAREVRNGDQITFSGTVKRHDIWRGAPQTQISRPKLLTLKPFGGEPPEAADQSAPSEERLTEFGPRRRFQNPQVGRASSLAPRITP